MKNHLEREHFLVCTTCRDRFHAQDDGELQCRYCQSLGAIETALKDIKRGMP